ncbi:MAG: SdpI family protein [Planctomycetes bacterium]|nr:SdpI family protein [Planctomycetota bacterium]
MMLSAVLFSGTGLLLVLLALPLLRRRVRPNGMYGLRTRATFADDRVWYEANARSARDLLVLGLVTIAVAWLLPLVPGVTEDVHALGLAAGLVIGALVLAAVGVRRAESLLRALQESEEDAPGP